MPSMQSISHTVCSRWPEMLIPAHKLPNESRVWHVACVSLSVLAKTTLVVSGLACVTISLSASSTALAVTITGLAIGLLIHDRAGACVMTAAIGGAGLLYVPAPFVASFTVALLAGQAIRLADAGLASYTIGKPGKKLTDSELEKELDAIAKSNREIKSLTICSHEGGYFNLNESMLNNLQEIEPQAIHTQHCWFLDSTIENLNRAWNHSVEKSDSLQFYRYAIHDPANGKGTLVLEKHSLAKPLCLAPSVQKDGDVVHYFKQCKIALETRSPEGGVQIDTITFDLRENNFEWSDNAMRALRAVQPKQIIFKGTQTLTEDRFKRFVGAFNSIGWVGSKQIGYSYTEHRGWGRALTGVFNLAIFKANDPNPQNFSIGHASLTLNEDSIGSTLLTLPGNCLATLSISSKESYQITQNDANLIARGRPKKIELTNCTLSTEALKKMIPYLNNRFEAKSVIYRESLAGTTFKTYELVEFTNTFKVANAFEAEQMHEFLDYRKIVNKSVPLEELEIECRNAQEVAAMLPFLKKIPLPKTIIHWFISTPNDEVKPELKDFAEWLNRFYEPDPADTKWRLKA